MKFDYKKFIEKAANRELTMAQALLLLIASGAVIAAGFYNPLLLSGFLALKHAKGQTGRHVQNSLSNLRRAKCVVCKYGRYELTTKGIQRAGVICIDTISVQKPRKWDGKWRIILFDIPMRFKKGREGLRWKLKDLGCKQLQKSVWAYPYPCEEEVLLVADFYGLRKYVEILTVDKALNEQSIKKLFQV